LKKHHNFVVKDIFSVRFQKRDVFFFLLTGGFLFIQVAMKACPYRADFYKKLAADPGGASVTDEKLDQELDNWSEALDSIITRMEPFYQKGGHNKGLNLFISQMDPQDGSPSSGSPSLSTPFSAAEDKRRRNTAASVRFRLKNKEREAA
jgi:hypothetical protein